MIKILLSAGHGAGKEHNRGSVCSNEGDNNYNYSLELQKALNEYEGVKVDLVRNKIEDNPSNTARAKILAQGYDLYLSLHSNAAGMNVRGTEVFDSIEKPNKPLAQALVDVTSKYFEHNNRGVKYRESETTKGKNYYGELRDNQAKSSMIIEHGFHTNTLDCLIFRDKQDGLARLQAEAIAKHYNLSKKATEDTQTLYKVQVGAYSIKANADKMLKDLETKGFKGYIVTEKKPNENNNRGEQVDKSEHFWLDGASIIKTRPENIEIKVIGKSLNKTSRSGINGTLFDTKTAPVTSPNSCVMIAMNEGKAISNNASRNGWNAPKRATIFLRADGKMSAKQVQTINELPSAKWAIGGFMVKPYMDFNNEKIPSGVNYKTGHSYIAFDDKDNIYLISKGSHNIREIVTVLDKLNIKSCIVLDGGGSTQMKYKGKDLFKTDRAINTAILLKEI